MRRSRQIGLAWLILATSMGCLMRAAAASGIDRTGTAGCARVVYFVDSGVPGYTCTIPGGSLLATHGGGSGGASPPCTVDLIQFDPITHDPPVDPATGNLIKLPIPGQWVFEDITTDTRAYIDQYGPAGTLYAKRFSFEPITWDYTQLNATNRIFTVSCQIPGTGIFYQSDLYVPLTDHFYQPGIDLAATELRGRLPLAHSAMVADPSVKAVGGLVTRHPTWLAIDPNTWTTATASKSVNGVTVTLAAFPIHLTFAITATNTDRGNNQNLTVDCAPHPGLLADTVRYPALDPHRPTWSEPGVQGPCLWTPAARGTTTITPVIDYRIDLLAGGSGRREPDLRDPGTPTTYETGSISVVNVNNP